MSTPLCDLDAPRAVGEILVAYVRDSLAPRVAHGALMVAEDMPEATFRYVAELPPASGVAIEPVRVAGAAPRAPEDLVRLRNGDMRVLLILNNAGVNVRQSLEDLTLITPSTLLQELLTALEHANDAPAVRALVVGSPIQLPSPLHDPAHRVLRLVQGSEIGLRLEPALRYLRRVAQLVAAATDRSPREAAIGRALPELGLFRDDELLSRRGAAFRQAVLLNVRLANPTRIEDQWGDEGVPDIEQLLPPGQRSDRLPRVALQQWIATRGVDRRALELIPYRTRDSKGRSYGVSTLRRERSPEDKALAALAEASVELPSADGSSRKQDVLTDEMVALARASVARVRSAGVSAVRSEAERLLRARLAEAGVGDAAPPDAAVDYVASCLQTALPRAARSNIEGDSVLQAMARAVASVAGPASLSVSSAKSEIVAELSRAEASRETFLSSLRELVASTLAKESAAVLGASAGDDDDDDAPLEVCLDVVVTTNTDGTVRFRVTVLQPRAIARWEMARDRARVGVWRTHATMIRPESHDAPEHLLDGTATHEPEPLDLAPPAPFVTTWTSVADTFRAVLAAHAIQGAASGVSSLIPLATDTTRAHIRAVTDLLDGLHPRAGMERAAAREQARKDFPDDEDARMDRVVDLLREQPGLSLQTPADRDFAARLPLLGAVVAVSDHASRTLPIALLTPFHALALRDRVLLEEALLDTMHAQLCAGGDERDRSLQRRPGDRLTAMCEWAPWPPLTGVVVPGAAVPAELASSVVWLEPAGRAHGYFAYGIPAAQADAGATWSSALAREVERVARRYLELHPAARARLSLDVRAADAGALAADVAIGLLDDKPSPCDAVDLRVGRSTGDIKADDAATLVARARVFGAREERVFSPPDARTLPRFTFRLATPFSQQVAPAAEAERVHLLVLTHGASLAFRGTRWFPEPGRVPATDPLDPALLRATAAPESTTNVVNLPLAMDRLHAHALSLAYCAASGVRAVQSFRLQHQLNLQQLAAAGDFARLHDHADWVMLAHPLLDRPAVESLVAQTGSTLHLIEYKRRTDAGTFAFTVSTGRQERVTASIRRLLAGLGFTGEVTPAGIGHLLGELRALSGGLTLRLSAPRTGIEAQGILGLLLSARALQSEHAGAVAITLDDAPWFDRSIGLRSDLVGVRVADDAPDVVQLVIAEAKLEAGGTWKATLERAKQQVLQTLQTIGDLFDPRRLDGLDRRRALLASIEEREGTRGTSVDAFRRALLARNGCVQVVGGGVWYWSCGEELPTNFAAPPGTAVRLCGPARTFELIAALMKA